MEHFHYLWPSDQLLLTCTANWYNLTQRSSRNARRTRRTRRKAKTPAKIRDVMASMRGGSRVLYLRWGERAHRKRRVRADENGRTPGPVARARAWGCVCRGSVREPSERVGENETRWKMQRACIEPARAILGRETAGGGSVHASELTEFERFANWLTGRTT